MANRTSTVGRDNDPLFVKNGVPVKFCFHRSVTQGRGQITRDVERHGGKIVPEERLANVLLVDEQEDLAFFRRRYYSSTELYRLSLYVEPRGFVQACIRAGTYRHAGPIKQGMPGLARGGGAGRVRVPFTEEDRDHLAYYIATRCPTRDGRMGNSAYKDLVRLGQTEDQSWEWARRHTVHSWREHYKMNPAMMDARIDYYLQRLKSVGHHLGHDPRRHDHRDLRQELEEGEEEEEEDGEDGEGQQQGIERQESERREQVRPAVAAERRPNQEARDYLARHQQDLVSFDEEEGDGIQEEEEEEEEEEVAIQESQRAKRHRLHPDAHRQRDSQESQAKRARVSEASSNGRRASGVEEGSGEGSAAREEDSDNGQDIEGSDLFGDRAYEESRFNFDDAQDIGFLMPSDPRTSPVPGQDGPPLSTQATLVASPRSADKGPTTPTEVVEAQVPTPEPTVPPSSQQTVVMTQERVIVQRARVRGASAQPGPSMPKETRTRGGAAAVEAPYRNTRARSRSVDPQPQHESQLPRERKDQGNSGKGKTKAKAKEEALVAIEEDMHVEEGQREEYAEEDVGPILVTGGLSTRDTFEDEMAVEGLLEASVENEDDEEDGEGEEGEHHKDGRNSDGDEDEDEDGDGDIVAGLPRFQEVEIGGEPSDSDDAETHASLVRGAAREGSVDGGGASEGGKSESDQDQGQGQDDEDSDDEDDADRIERMASESLHAAPAPTPLQPRVTRSMAATQTQTQISPRRTRSGNQARAAPAATVFPSPGTKARAVVNRFQEEERRMPYAPPPGSRAATVAKAVKGRGRRG